MKKLWALTLICGLLALFVLPAAAMHYEGESPARPESAST
jgi:hypothetical protein